MAENESLRMALEHYRQRKAEKLTEVQELDLMISRLSRDLGDTSQETPADREEEDSSNTGISEAWQENEYGSTAKNGAKTTLRPDEFFGMTYSIAAEAYLNKVGHAVSMDELLDALNRGGCPVGGREPRKTLYISLVRDVRTFVPIAGRTGFLGLRKFYPNLKALKEKEPKAKHKKRRKKKAKRAARAAETVPKGKPGPKPKSEKPPSSIKEKSHLATDQTAQKGEAM
jgi:hypothetical protein